MAALYFPNVFNAKCRRLVSHSHHEVTINGVQKPGLLVLSYFTPSAGTRVVLVPSEYQCL